MKADVANRESKKEIEEIEEKEKTSGQKKEKCSDNTLFDRKLSSDLQKAIPFLLPPTPRFIYFRHLSLTFRSLPSHPSTPSDPILCSMLLEREM